MRFMTVVAACRTRHLACAVGVGLTDPVMPRAHANHICRLHLIRQSQRLP